MTNWLKNLYKAVISLFRKKRKEQGYMQFKKKLDESFYGTLVERGSKATTYRKKHKKNGWRDGKSNPFRWEGRWYDKGKNIDKSVELYEELSDKIGDKHGNV